MAETRYIENQSLMYREKGSFIVAETRYIENQSDVSIEGILYYGRDEICILKINI